MPGALHRLWIRWTALLATVLLLLLLGAGGLVGVVERKLAAPELEKTTLAIGGTLVRQIERALALEIPVGSLVGVDEWFDEVGGANSLLAALLLTDPSGRELAAYRVTPQLRERMTQGSGERSERVDGMHVASLPVRDRRQAIVAWLHVGSQAPALGVQAWGWALALVAGLAVLAALLLRTLIQRYLAQPLQACRAACGALADAGLPEMPPMAMPSLAVHLHAALAERVAGLRKRQAFLLLKIGEVRAAHFDAGVLQQLDALAEPVAARQRPPQPSRQGGGSDDERPVPSAVRRATRALLIGLAVLLLSLLAVQQAMQQTDRQRLLEAGGHALQQAWRATLEQDAVLLDAALEQLLAEAGFLALLAGNDDQALDAVLEGRASRERHWAVFHPDGRARAASGSHDESTRIDPATLEALRQGREEIRGVWQNAARHYQSGVVRRLALAPGKEALLMVAQPLDVSLRQLGERLAAPVTAADLRGQPLFGEGAAQVAAWRRQGRTNRVAGTGEDTVLQLAQPLAAPSGHALGTLLASLPVTSRSADQTLFLLLPGAAGALLAVLGLFFYLRGLFAPLAKTMQRLERLAGGNTDAEPPTQKDSRETRQLFRIVRRIGEKIDALETLRRSRERQGRRQARFIRLQMMELAARLDEKARCGILEDLDRIEHATQPAAALAAADPRLERIADEFGILALGFQNLVSRVGHQYEELDRLVNELREALRTRTQFIALQQEIEIARKMQLSILPHEYRSRGGLELHATMVPAKEIGGDFYDFFNLDEHRVGLVVADVSGKGVAAAFFMAIARTLLSAIAQFSDSPAACVARLNDLLAADNDEMMFVTLFYGIFDTRDGSLSYTNAGHNPPYLLRADGRVEIVPGTHDMALAVLESFAFHEGRVVLDPGDGLFMYTDGVIEASNDIELYGAERLVAALAMDRDLPVREIPDRMLARVKEFEAGAAQADDITCLMLRYRGRP